MRDADRSATWYHKVLGFERTGEYRAPDGSRKVFMRDEGPSVRLRLTGISVAGSSRSAKLQSGWTTWRSRCPPGPSSAIRNGASPRPASYIYPGRARELHRRRGRRGVSRPRQHPARAKTMPVPDLDALGDFACRKKYGDPAMTVPVRSGTPSL